MENCDGSFPDDHPFEEMHSVHNNLQRHELLSKEMNNLQCFRLEELMSAVVPNMEAR